MKDACHSCGLRNPPGAQLLHTCVAIGCGNKTCTDADCRALKTRFGFVDDHYVCSQCVDDHKTHVIKETR